MAKAQLKLKLASTTTRGTIKRAFKSILVAKGEPEITLLCYCLLIDEDGHLKYRDILKVETFNAFFPSVFNTDDGPAEFATPARYI